MKPPNHGCRVRVGLPHHDPFEGRLLYTPQTNGSVEWIWGGHTRRGLSLLVDRGPGSGRIANVFTSDRIELL